MAKKKNTVQEKKVQPKYPIVLSDKCEKCQERCQRGIKYLERFNQTKKGNGVVCKKQDNYK